MASCDDVVTDDQLIEKFKECSIAAGSKNPLQFTSKANGKFVESFLKPKYGKYQVGNISDASVFPTCKPKTQLYMDINRDTVAKYVNKISLELAKRKAKPADAKALAANSEATMEIEKDVRQAIATGTVKVKQVATSKTGNVDGLTDTSKYTGTHKGRFDDSGKGKGKEGRVEMVDDSGYVGSYKGKDTYDKKK